MTGNPAIKERPALSRLCSLVTLIAAHSEVYLQQRPGQASLLLFREVANGTVPSTLAKQPLQTARPATHLVLRGAIRHDLIHFGETTTLLSQPWGSRERTKVRVRRIRLTIAGHRHLRTCATCSTIPVQPGARRRGRRSSTQEHP